MSQFNDVMNKKAVALTYDEERHAAPVIVASGTGYMAERIIETAQECGVPVYEDNSLATVLTQLELGSEIPEQLYQAIVDIYVYFLNFADKNKAAAPQPQPAQEEQQEQAQETGEEAETGVPEPPEAQQAE